MRPLKTLLRVAAALALLSTPAISGEIGTAKLDILGMSLEVVTNPPIATGIDIPAIVPTKFGGKMNADAPPSTGFLAVGELTGPGIDTPIIVTTQPGHPFELPALRRSGDYSLRNIRLVTSPGGLFVQQAVPSSVNVNVSDVLKPSVTVRQLTPDDLRARGITIDSRNYDYYEYTFVFAVKGSTVVVPYSVVVDRRTNQPLPPPADNPYYIPSPQVGGGVSPRFEQPNIGSGVLTPELPPDVQAPPIDDGGGGTDSDRQRLRPTIPAAIVLPTNFGVLHQFFAVILNVTNNAPAGTSIQLDSVRAVMTAPQALRVAKIEPAVSIGQAVPVRAADGSTFLIAQAEGSAEWTLEALRAGTHTLKLELNATYRAPNQPDIAMKGVLPATISVADPRFQINFVHPDTIRANENYTAYAFVTNTSTTPQTVTLNLDSHIPLCSTGGSAFGICVVEALSQQPLTIASGATVTVPYKLQSKITGHIFATAGTADEAISLSVALSMGVSESGVPLSPATLLMPYYAQFVDRDFVSAYMPLLGLGYSLATAPVNAKTAQFPRLIRSDVFRRAQDIARAGQRSFVVRRNRTAATADENREPLFHLALDLLCNVERTDLASSTPDFHEWDQFRRTEPNGRKAAEATARLLESVAFAGGRSMSTFVNDFATATSHRTPFALALVHGISVAGTATPYELTVKTASGATLANVSDLAGPWTREIPFGELTQFYGNGGEQGQLAMIGRWGENLRVTVVAHSVQFTLELLYPDSTDGSLLHAKLDVTAMTGQPVTFTVDRASTSIAVSGGTAVASIHAVAQTPLAMVAAAQDITLDSTGRTVALLMNRPLHVADALKLRDEFTISTAIAQLSYDVTRRNDATHTPVTGAALQDDGRLLILSFNKALSANATYRVGTAAPLRDLRNDSNSIVNSVVPRLDDGRPGGVVYGSVLLADNTPVKQTAVQLSTGDGWQYDTTDDNGAFLFEYVARDLANNRSGYYTLDARSADNKAASLEGSIRTVGELQHVNLVFIGRGSAQGHVRYSDGEIIAGARVTAGNSLYGDLHSATTDANGFFSIGDLAVGPITFAAVDAKGTVTYATSQLRTAGELLVQDLVVQRRTTPGGFGRVRVTVRRSDKMSDPDPNASLVPGARVGIYSQGFGLVDGFTDGNGQAYFEHIPAGQISVLAAEFSIAKRSNGAETDLKPDQLVEQTVILEVPPLSSPQFVTVKGVVFRDDPAAPNDTTRVTTVAGAIVTFKGFPAVTADAQGRYVVYEVPVTYANLGGISVFDPSTSRSGSFNFPTLQAGQENTLDLKLSSKQPQGKATLRVRVVSALGEPVDNYRVISPGFPPDSFIGKGGGVYERIVDVPQSLDVWAIGVGHAKYGDQTAHGSVAADFDGQIAAIELRLPGQGTVIAKTEILGTCSLPGCTPQWISSPGPLNFAYRVWSEVDQQLMTEDHLFTPGADGLVHATKIPAGETSLVETFEHPGGYAKSETSIGFEGDLKNVTLRLSSLGNVTGRVVNYDGTTPVAGASVRLIGGAFDGGTTQTLADGSFVFPGIAANASFRIEASAVVDGIFRKGYVDSATPVGGGPVSGLVLVMREQANISGTIRDANGAPVALAHYWVRELSWPYRAFGSASEPLIAGSNGSFFANNIFAGPFRVTAVSPVDQEARGDLQGSIAEENGDRNGLSLVIGAAGTGTINVTVYDSNSGFTTVPNAEVALQVSGLGYDFTVANASGFAVFEQIPVGRYTIRAISRAVGRSGASEPFDVTRNGATNVRVSLTFIGTLRGTIVDADNDPPTPVAGAAVFLRGGGLDARASTDANGSYVFNAVPEGRFSIEAIDLASGRSVKTAEIYELSALVQNLNAGALPIERSGTVNLTVSLPNDAGLAGEIAPLVDVTVVQWGGYSRSQQGRGQMTFNKLFTTRGFNIEVRELGGLQRTLSVVNSHFATGAHDANVSLVFSTTGAVEVTVLGENEQPARGVLLDVSDGTRSFRVYTNDSGFARVDGLPLSNIFVRATSGNISASDGGTIVSHSTPLRLTLHLGNRIDVVGRVFAEEGVNVASIGTSVLADVSSPLFQFGTVRMQTRTDANGDYRFGAIPVSNTSITLTFVGPDEVTAGDRIHSFPIPNGQTGELRMRDAKLDATPPRVLSIDPADNANSVSPTASVAIAFSEDLADLSASSFSLIATDNNQSTSFAMTASKVNGIFRVTLTPGAKLRSNVVYRVNVLTSVHDAAGNLMKSQVGSSFTTVDYTEPRVISVTPSTVAPIPDGATFRLKFNKPIDATAFAPNGGGVLTLERLKTYKGELLQPLAFTFALDATDASTLIVAPTGTAIEPSSYYRLTVNGARDTQPVPAIQTIAQIFDFFSYDVIAPVVTIQSPVPAGSPLIAGQVYWFIPLMTDGAGGAPSSDIAFVDWTYQDGTTTRVKTGNYSLAPVIVAATDGTYTLKAKATDLSGNESTLATLTLNVVANEAPKNVVITTTAPTTFVGRTIAAHVAFTDEGTLVTTKLTASGTKKDGTPFVFTDDLIHPTPNRQISRANVGVPWTGADYTIDVPSTLKSGTNVTLTATVVDSSNKTSDPATAAVAIVADTLEPQVTITAPIAETQYTFGTGTTKFAIKATAADAESGIAHLTIAYDGKLVDLPASSATRDAAGAWLFTTNATVTAKNVDTRIHITVTAFDYDGNSKQQVVDVIYKSVDIPNVPKAAWITPLDGAALVAGETNVPLKLRIRATAEPAGFHPTVRFTSDAFVSAPAALTAPTSGSDIYEQIVNVNVPATGSFTIEALVDDADPSHQVVLPIAIDAVVPDAPIVVSNFEINEQNLATYSDKTVVVRGASTRLNIDTPATLRNLIIIGGATVGTRDGVRLDATILEHLYVDGDSSIDVSGKGYRGGWAKSDDGTFTNNSSTGITLGNTTVGGATPGASASHAGSGGADSGSTTNATYGSITSPSDFGSGGAGAPTTTASTPGGNGGGAVSLRGGIARFVIAGAIRADGETGIDRYNAGAGGSLVINTRALITGPATRITANGGDDNALDGSSRGAGGGRVSITATERLELDSIAAELQARGGRNNTANEARSYHDGGAGTLFLRRPSATNGELLVSSYDDRFATSAHPTRPTPLTSAMTFDAVTIGPRALARFDDAYPANITIDTTAVAIHPNGVPTFTFSSIPASGGEVIRGSNIATTYSAHSNAGIVSVAPNFAPAGTISPDAYATAPLDTTTVTRNIAVPTNAPLGSASLTARITDRAGRTVDVPPVSITVIDNTAPTFDKFVIDPSTLIDPAALTMYPGHKVTATISASDDAAITKLTFLSTLAGVAATPIVSTPNTKSVVDATFLVDVPPTTAAGATLRLDATVEDNLPAHATTLSKTITILKDSIAPSITVTEPVASSTILDEATSRTIVVTATVVDAQVAVKQVFATVDGITYAMTASAGSSVYSTTVPMPDVTGSAVVDIPVTVTALDYENNSSTSSVINVHVRPFLDVNAPVVSFVYPSVGAAFPAGYTLKLRANAIGNSVNNATNSVQKLDFVVTLNGTTSTVNATRVGTSDLFDGTFTIPAATPDNAIASVNAVATNVASLTSSANAKFTVLVVAAADNLTQSATIASTDATHDNRNVAVSGSTTVVTLAGTHTLRNLMMLDNAELSVNGSVTAAIVSLANGGKLAHSRATSTAVNRLALNATTNVTIDTLSSIDVSLRGLTGNVSSVGYTYDQSTGLPTLTGGANAFNAGSHGGAGGIWNGVATTPYGSLFDPNEPGAAGSTNTTCAVCSSGGGVVRLQAPSLVLDGAIKANGEAVDGGAAGGSVRIDADAITGVGEIHADGGRNTSGASGGGGRVALYYKTLSLTPTKITASSAAANGGRTTTGGAAGTVYLRRNDASGAKLGEELVFDNAGVTAMLGSTIATAGNGTISAIAGNVLTLSAAVPLAIESTTLELLDANGSVTASYVITARTNNSVTVDTTPVNATVGTAYRGVPRFDKITLRGGAVFTAPTVATNLLAGATTTTARLNELHSANALTLSGGNVELNGSLTSASLALADAVKITHAIATTTTVNRINIKVAGAMTIDALSSIAVDAKGIAGNVSGTAYTYDTRTGLPTLNGGATAFNAGSHGGAGGQWNGPLGASYGSLFDPNEPGAAGSNNSSCASCNAGGGVIRIAAGSLSVDGNITADGESVDGAGAGGSIRIDAATISGSGRIHANGGRNTSGASGGGGRIALYGAVTLPSANITASSAVSAGGGDNRNGAPGTIFKKSPSQTYGSLIVDNGTITTTNKTTLTSVGNHIATQVSTNSVTDSNASFEVLNGIRLVLNGDATKSWPIVSNTRTAITVTPDAAFQPAVGNAFRGLDRFDAITLVNARVDTDDLLITDTPVTRDAVSTIAGGNAGAPVVNAAAIHIVSGSFGQSVVASAGAVSDPDAPITVFIANARTGVTLSVTAAADGSFFSVVEGKLGDVITVSAKDSHAQPMTSATVSIGTLTADTPTVTQLPLASFGVDSTFRPRALAATGRTLAIVSDATAISDKVVLFNTTSPLAPATPRVVSTGDGTNRSVLIDHGWVFVGAQRVNAFDSSLATPVVTRSTNSGPFVSLASIGHYLYAATSNGGGVSIFDITTPSAPVSVRLESLYFGESIAFTSMVPVGTKYLALISANKSASGAGHDVVIYDVHDPAVWTAVVDFDVPAFDASRGVLSGNLLHLTSATGSEEVLVDVTDVAHPSVVGRVAIGSGVRGVDAAASHAYAAIGSGVAFIDNSVPAAPQYGGSVSVGATANDVRIGGGALYVAHDGGLAVINVNEAPVLAPSLVTVTVSGSNAVASGAVGAVIGGSGTITLELRDGSAFGTVTANADGSFIATVPAALGDELTIKATDTTGRISGPHFLGTVPIPKLVINTANISVAFNGSTTAVTGAANAVTGGKPPLKIDISNRSRTVAVTTVTANADGSFAGSVSTLNGDSVGITVTDALNTKVGPTIVGRATVPLALNTAVVSMTNVAGIVRVSAPAGAVTGTGAISLTVTSGTKSATTSALSDGSFSVNLSGATAGNPLTISATDSIPSTVGPLSLGKVPISLSINGSLITVATHGVVNGAAGAVTGKPPLTITLRAGAVTSAPFAANADGSFTGTVAGAAFDSVILTLSDGTSTTSLTVGTIPASLLSIDTSLISVARGGVVTGLAGAITADPPFTMTVRAGAGPPVNTIPNNDGSFTATVAGVPGDRVTVTLTDGSTTTSRDVGGIPIAGSLAITNAMSASDANFRARTLAVGGNSLVIGSYPDDSGTVGTSDKLLVFDVTDPTNPIYRQTYTLDSSARSAVIDNGWAFVGTGTGLTTIDLTASSGAHAVSCACAAPSNGIAVIGHYAYTINGTSLVEYDITSRSAPVVSRTDEVNATFRALVCVDNRYLALLTATSGANSNNLRVFDTAVHDIIGFTTLPFVPVRGRASGSMLYVAGEIATFAGVDLTNPQQPVVLSSLAGSTIKGFGVDTYGTTAAVASGSPGVYLIDVATPTPRLITAIAAAQPAWDTAYNSGVLYVATDTSLYIATAQSQPPVIDASRIRVSSSGTNVTIAGTRGAVAGAGVVATVTHGATDVAVPLQSDGSFTLQFSGTAGETLTIRATDNAQRTIGPISLGRSPYGSSLAITTAMTDAAFRARQLLLSGTTLLVASRDAASDAIVVYDIATPAAPLYKQTLRTGLGALQNFTAADGRAFVSYERGITMFDLRGATPVATTLPQPDGVPGALTVIGNYLFVSVVKNGAMSIASYDLADPAAIRMQATSDSYVPAALVSMTPLDATHFAAAGSAGPYFGDVSSAYDPGVSNNDTTFLPDDVAAIGASRIFMASATRKLREWQRDAFGSLTFTTIATAGAARGIDAAGTTLYVADGAAGLSLVDASNAQQPVLLRSLSVGGNARDVRVGRGVVYVANETGFAIVAAPDVTTEPTIDARAVTVQTDGATTATVNGAATAIGAASTATVNVTNGANTSISTAVDAFGAFAPLTLTAPPGGALVAHVDAASKSSQRSLTPVPFANGVTSYVLTTAKSGDASAHFRRVAIDGTRLVASHGYSYNTFYYGAAPSGSDALFIFDTTKAIATQTPLIVRVGSHIEDFAVANGFAFVAAGDFLTIDLATGTIHRVSGHGGSLSAVAISGSYAFAGGAVPTGATEAPLQLYDVTNPAAPAFIREQVIAAGETITGIHPLDSRYLGIFTDGAQGHVRIVDRQNVSALVAVGDVSRIYAARGTVSGNTFYVCGDYAGVTAIDIADPAHPAVVGSIDTRSGASAVAISGTNELAVADGVAGVTFLDVTDRTAIRIKGTQQVPGAPADLAVSGKTLYVASELELDALVRP